MAQNNNPKKKFNWRLLVENSASLISVLSGNPYSRDDTFRRIQSHINHGRHSQNLKFFKIPVTRFGTPYDALWVKSPNGVYTIVKT